MATSCSAITPDTKIGISPRVYARHLGDGIVLLDFALGEYFELDSVGAEIWRGLERGESLRGIADLLAERWDVHPDRALNDLVHLVSEMLERTLVERAP